MTKRGRDMQGIGSTPRREWNRERQMARQLKYFRINIEQRQTGENLIPSVRRLSVACRSASDPDRTERRTDLDPVLPDLID